MNTLIAILLIVHGFIVTAQSSGSFNPAAGITNPSWLSFWPSNLGQSWLLTTLGIERTFIARAGGILWLVAGLSLMAAGLGVLGFVVPTSSWRSLALVGAVTSLIMLVIYLHPFYGIGIGASIVLLIALVSRQGLLFDRFGL